MAHAGKNYTQLQEQIKQFAHKQGRDMADICLIAVSKTHSPQVIQQVYEAGCRDFGENRVQEALVKQPELPSDSRWHFIGTLQSNKVNKVISHFHLIHSVDHPLLARNISDASLKQGVVTPILLQVNTSGEKSKHGLTGDEWMVHLKDMNSLPGIQLEGLMTIAPHTEDGNRIRMCFRQLRLFRDQFQQKVKDPHLFKHLSMGMSHDYLIAIEEGATCIRLGSAIFGCRTY